MSSPVVGIDSTILCAHAGAVKIIPSNMKVTVGGVPVAVQTDTTLVSGCPFTVPPGTPMPCVPVQWMTAATKVTVNGTPVLLKSSMGMNTGVGPPAPVNIVVTQTKVTGT